MGGAGAGLLVVELGLGLLVPWTQESRGGCELRKFLGSLFADGWDCVPNQLVVWPEISSTRTTGDKMVGWHH